MKIEEIHNHSVLANAFELFCNKHKVLFVSSEWLQIYDHQHVHTCVILNKNNEVIGCFVYYTFKKASFNLIITPPYSPHIDLFFVNPAESIVGKNTFEKELTESLSKYFKSLKYDYLNLNLPLNVVDTQSFIWNNFQSRHRFTYLIDLSVDEESLWNNLSSEKRKSIKKAEKDGLSIELATQYEPVLEMILKSLSRNEKAKNTSIIKNILFKFANNNNAFAFVAKQGQTVLAATFCIVYGNKAMYLFGGFEDQNSHHGAHVSCMWQSILMAKKNKLQFFDFEGSMNKSIERYFREFGGEIKSYSCIEDIKPGFSLLLKMKGGKPL